MALFVRMRKMAVMMVRVLMGIVLGCRSIVIR